MIAIWDDHEFSDDCWQDRQEYSATDDSTPQTARRRSASQAWFENMPADVQLDLNNPSFQNIQIYRSFVFGDLATLVMTDERLYRSDHIIPETQTGSEIGVPLLRAAGHPVPGRSRQDGVHRWQSAERVGAGRNPARLVAGPDEVRHHHLEAVGQ